MLPSHFLNPSDLNAQRFCAQRKCRDPGSNRGPSDLRSDALPAELSRLVISASGTVRRGCPFSKRKGEGGFFIFWKTCLGRACKICRCFFSLGDPVGDCGRRSSWGRGVVIHAEEQDEIAQGGRPRARAALRGEVGRGPRGLPSREEKKRVEIVLCANLS